MLDKFQLIPAEAFQPMADVANNLIEKASDAVGYIFTPHGKAADNEEAVQYLINKIKEDESMPLLAKAAAISRSRKLIKE